MKCGNLPSSLLLNFRAYESMASQPQILPAYSPNFFTGADVIFFAERLLPAASRPSPNTQPPGFQIRRFPAPPPPEARSRQVRSKFGYGRSRFGPLRVFNQRN